jgi:hypothetical protein
MLKNIRQLYGNKLGASDGDIGHVKDFYFDDTTWTVRYLVADTGSWLAGRLVLLSPHAFGRFDPEGKVLSINLSRKQIEESPSIESHRPISRQYEEDYYRYYGWPVYWEGGQMWGMGSFPVFRQPPGPALHAHRAHPQQSGDIHLRSAQAIAGYHIQTVDGTIGHVSSFLVDDKSWLIGELVVETGHWFSGKEILIAPGKIERIDYETSKVFVSLTKEDIQRASGSGIAQAVAGDIHK